MCIDMMFKLLCGWGFCAAALSEPATGVCTRNTELFVEGATVSGAP